MKIEIIKLRDTAAIPQYQTVGSAGMDIRACIDEAIILQPLERKMIPAGFSIALPEGYEAQIRARSGLSIKHGITMVNGVGTVDADYRGEVGVLLINLSNESFVVEPNMRIAQMIIARYVQAQLVEVDELPVSERGSGGFGSTGRN